MKVSVLPAALIPFLLGSLLFSPRAAAQAGDGSTCGTVLPAAVSEATPEPGSQNLGSGPLFRPYGSDDPAQWWEFHPLGVFVAELNDWVFFDGLAGQDVRIWGPEFSSGALVTGVERYEVVDTCQPAAPPPPTDTDTPPSQPSHTPSPPPTDTPTPPTAVPAPPPAEPPAAEPNLFVAFDLSPVDGDRVTVFKPNLLRLEVTNMGEGVFVPPDPRDYRIELVVKQAGKGKVEEHTFSPGDVRPADLPSRLENGGLFSLRVENVFLFTPVEDGQVEVFFLAAGESNLEGNGAVQDITISAHPESGWNCAAWIAKAVPYVYPPALVPAAIAEWFFQMETCRAQPSAGNDGFCYARATAWWIASLLTRVKEVWETVRDLIELVVQVHDMQELLGQTTLPCSVGLDWIKAMVQEWSRQGLPINAVIVRSPAYPLVTTASGQRVGFLDDGLVIAEVPDAAAFLEGESKVVLYPGTDTAQIRLRGTADGPVSLSLVVSGPGGATALDYPAVQVNASTVGTARAEEGFQTLHLDQDGDGSEDAQVAALEAEPDADLPPALPEPASLAGRLGRAVRQNPRLAAGLGILALLLIVAGAVLALVLVRSGAVRREASPFGQAPAPRGLDSRRTQYLGGIEPPARQSHPGPRPSPALTPRLAPPGAAVLVDRTRPERVYPVQGTTSVGRSRHNEIVLEDLTVSRQHAWLRLEGGECWLQDAGSTNGTYINGRLVHQPRRLRHGDVVRFGQVELVFAQEG